ncbi:Rho GTPase activation protein [Phlyctochytrium arcticum]|nr:Rho GTPase activation protein [Phlyctochytrium arcticum]
MRFVDEIDSDLPPADAETMAFSNITSVPPEIIRREGWLAAKLKSRESASNNALNASGPGNAPLSPVASSKVSKRLESWRTMWTVLCVGFLIFFKEDPAKSKRACKPVRVIHLNKVTLEAVGKSHTKKKNAFSLVPDRGATWLLQPNTESEVFDWMDAIKEASRERSTANEYENSSSKLLATPPLDGSVDLPELPRVASKNVKEETRQTRTRRATTSKSIPTEPLDDFEGRKSNVKSKLGAFFSKRPTVERLKEKGILRDEDQIFGGHLATQVRPGAPPGDNIPVVVRMCVKEVDERGLTSQGIYRLSGNASTVQKIRVQFNQQEHVNLSDESLDINAVASVLKLYFRELQDPLIPFAFYNNFIAAAKVEDYDTRLINVKTLIQSLPRPNYDTLEFLMRHLSRVSARSDVNKMEPSNLAIVFGPTLVRMPDEGQTAYLNMLNMTYHNSLMEGVLVQTEWIFDGSTS